MTEYPDVHVTAGWWACRHPGCAFRRFFATREGAIQGAAKHLREEHLVRLMLPARHHGGMVHGGRA